MLPMVPMAPMAPTTTPTTTIKLDAAFVILSQATPERVVYLKSTLYFLFKRFNARPECRYPVRVLHEGDFGPALQAELRACLRGDAGDLLSFVRLDAGDFVVPPWIDRDRLERNLRARPVPYWRDLRYRLMCRFWLVHAHKYVADLAYFCRLDDDAWLEEDVPFDIFEAARSTGSSMAGAIVHVDCPVCTHGMRSMFRGLGLANDANDAALFVRAPLSPAFLEGIDASPDRDDVGAIVAPMPVMLYNNFSVCEVAFWRRPDVLAALRAVDATGNVFYFRWGDAPVLTLVARTLGRLTILKLRYTKRLQREAFVDASGAPHRYMPASYAVE